MDINWIIRVVLIYELGAFLGARRFWVTQTRSNQFFMLLSFLTVGQITALIMLFLLLILALNAFITTLLNWAIWGTYWVENLGRSEASLRIVKKTKEDVREEAGENWRKVTKMFDNIFPVPDD